MTKSCDLVMSLGTNCEIAYNLRMFYGIERAGLLDWMITPPSAVVWIVNRGFQLVGAEFADELMHVEVDGTDSIIHEPSGILLHHAFGRDSAGRIIANWRSEIPAVKEKHLFLANRMNVLLEDAQAPLLFVNRDSLHPALSPTLCAQSQDVSIYRRILDALADRYPRTSPVLAIINGNHEALAVVADDSRVVSANTRYIGDWHEGVEGHFAGCATGWRTALASLPITVASA